ncbi:MAG: transglycosylase domain-containing protein [Paracoccaceae bacterium]
MVKGKRRKPRKVAKHGLLHRLFRWIFGGILRLIWWTGLRAAGVTALVLFGATAYYFLTLPAVGDLLDGRDRGSVILLDRNSQVFAWRGDQYGGDIRATSISPHLKNAVIATEDKRFYSHFGIDPRGIVRAMAHNIRAGRLVQGGSTITQQVAKMVFLDRGRTLERKIKEIPIALAMELKYKQDEIRSIYLHRAYLGAGSYGFEAASRRYFGKSAREVNAAEAAMLAGLLKAPTTYAPTRDISVSQRRAGIIVDLMQEQGYLSPAEARDARANPAVLSQAAARRAGGYFADWVMSTGPDFLTSETTEDVQIRTTFDPEIQKAAEQALVSVFENKVRKGSNAQAAIVVMSPDGAVRAMVGGRRIGQAAGQFNRATQALRQPGSAFKPFVYGAALEAGFTPFSLVEDAPITIDIPGSGPWSPKNYTRQHLGLVTMTEAMARSINTVAVRVSEEIGRERVKALARDFGIESPLADGPAIALGASEVTLLELTGAYAGILNRGRLSKPFGIEELKLRGDDYVLMGSTRSEGYRVMNETADGYLVYMMNQVVEKGSGGRARLPGRQVAGKTGTTTAARDAWFIGFTADYVAGVWMGYDDNTPLTGVTGSGLPAEIWRETMTRVEAGHPPRPLPMVRPDDYLASDNNFLDGRRRQDRRSKLDRQIEGAARNIVEELLDGIFGTRRRN